MMKQVVFFSCLLVAFSHSTLAQKGIPAVKTASAGTRQVTGWLYQENHPASVHTSEGRPPNTKQRPGEPYFFLPGPMGLPSDWNTCKPESPSCRSVRPEAEILLDGIPFEVGGLSGQPVHNYLLPEWIASMQANPGSFKTGGPFRGKHQGAFSPGRSEPNGCPKICPGLPPAKNLFLRTNWMRRQ